MKIPLLLIAILFSSTILAETKNEDHHAHHHHLNEIGIANSMVYILGENESAYGLHLHYVRYIPHTKFGYGVGYERIFGQHQHNTLGIVGSYNPFGHLYFSLIPGITFEDKSNKMDLAMHFEVLYEFEFNDFHIGPTVGYSFNPEDKHLSLGVHIAYAFD